VDKKKFELHQRMSAFAVGVYKASLCSSPKDQVSEFELDSPDDILMLGFEGNDIDHRPCFAVLQDQQTDSVVLTIRGTFSLTDVIIDIVCSDEEFLGGYAHRLGRV
jgi:hypothetical protein